MLAMLGGVIFEIAPLNYTSLNREMEASWATHEVVGSPKVYEHTGEGNRSITIKGKVFPEFSGGLGELDALDGMRLSGQPYHFMRGDGVAGGWVILTKISIEEEEIGFGGVGRAISFTLTLERVGQPASGAAASLIGIFLEGAGLGTEEGASASSGSNISASAGISLLGVTL